MIVSPFNDNRQNVETLRALLRLIEVPKDHTGQLMLRLHFHQGVVGRTGFELHNIKLEAS